MSDPALSSLSLRDVVVAFLNGDVGVEELAKAADVPLPEKVWAPLTKRLQRAERNEAALVQLLVQQQTEFKRILSARED